MSRQGLPQTHIAGPHDDRHRAAKHHGGLVDGHRREGPTVAGNFQEGQTIEGAFSFQPGKCYTVVAVGAGIQEIDIEMQYVTPIPGLAPSIGKDTQKGAQASIGGKGNCLKPLSPIPANAKFIVRAAKGAGVAAAQLYSK